MNYVEHVYNIQWKHHKEVHLYVKVLQVKIVYFKHNNQNKKYKINLYKKQVIKLKKQL